MSRLTRYKNSNINDSLNSALSHKTSGGDARFWNLTRGQDGNGTATVRFIPYIPEDEGRDIITMTIPTYTYRFTNALTGRTYDEWSLETIGKPDPVQEHWAMLWNSGRKEEAKLVSRSISYYANVLIMKDIAKPENQGQVRIYRFGKTIKDMLLDVSKDDRDGLPSINPFELYSYPRTADDDQIAAWIKSNGGKPGANCIIRAKSRGGEQNFPSYETSGFEQPSTLGNADLIEDVLGRAYDLSEFTDPGKFKSYSELEANLALVMGWTGNVYASAAVPKPTVTEFSMPTDASKAKGTLVETLSPVDASLQGDMAHLESLIAEAR